MRPKFPPVSVIAAHLEKHQKELSVAKARRSVAIGVSEIDLLDRKILKHDRLVKFLERELITATEREQREGTCLEAKSRIDAFNNRAPEIARAMAKMVDVVKKERAVREAVAAFNGRLLPGRLH